MKKFVLALLSIVAYSNTNVCAEEAQKNNDTPKAWYDYAYKGLHGKTEFSALRIFVENKYGGERGKLTSMNGGRLSGTYVYPNGFTVKPSLLAASGQGHLYTGGIAAGWYLPAGSHFSFIPTVGYSQSYLKTKNIKIVPEGSGLPFTITSDESSIQSRVETVGLDAIIRLNEKWALAGTVQYGWSQSRSHMSGMNPIEIPQSDSRSESRGFNSGASIEYFINDSWSTSLAYAHNNSNDKEINGVEGEGFLLSAGYRF